MVKIDQSVASFIHDASTSYLLRVEEKDGESTIFAEKKTFWVGLKVALMRGLYSFFSKQDSYQLSKIAQIVKADERFKHQHHAFIARLDQNIEKYNERHPRSTIEKISRSVPWSVSEASSSTTTIPSQTTSKMINVQDIKVTSEVFGRKRELSNLQKKVLDAGIVHQGSNKHQWYTQAIELWQKLNMSAIDVLQASRMDPASLSQFKLTASKKPDYFSQCFQVKSAPVALQSTSGYFNYTPTPNAVDYWVDFANASLGGACFGGGQAQEEQMALEMPDFAELIASQLSQYAEGWSDIYTREAQRSFPKHPGNEATPKQLDDFKMDVKKYFDDRRLPCQGDPNPYLLKNLHRVQEVNFNNGTATPFTQEQVQRVNIVAIAAPRLDRGASKEKQLDPNTLSDIFNTLVAGITLVQKNETQKMVIHSGRFGCGAFSNHEGAVYLLHCLVSEALGVEIQMHGYRDENAKVYQGYWQKIQPSLHGKTFDACINEISQFLLKQR